MLPFSIQDLQAAVLSGSVTKRDHPTLPLSIYNYSKEAQYQKNWNDVTLNCRGLILDEDHNIVARPWKKFFNLGEVNLPLQFDDPVEVMDKADGSLGILYPAGEGYAVSTRGSFASEQAVHATEVWNEKYSHLSPVEGYTYLFEIIYSANRIVLDYGDTDDLILLGAVETKTGYYLGPKQAQQCFHVPHVSWGWTGPVVDVYEHKSISDAIGAMGRENKEGYVIRSHNFMVKVKEPDYIELHRLVTNASPKTVWEQLRAGKSKTEIVSQFPDEFHDYIGDMADPLLDKYEVRLETIIDGFFSAKAKMDDEVFKTVGRTHAITRGDYAREFKKHADARYYFLLLDERPIRDTLWQELRPSTQE